MNCACCAGAAGVATRRSSWYTPHIVGLVALAILTAFSVRPSVALAASSTKTYISASASSATIYRKVALTGRLVTRSGRAISGGTLRLERLRSGSWILVKTATTNRYGKVAVNVQPSGDTGYRYRFGGSKTYAKSVSAAKTIGGYTAPSISWNGSGTTVVGPFTLEEGLSVFSSQPGPTDTNFIVWLVDSNGEEVDLLANEIGQTASKVAVNIPVTARYYLNVDSDTTWDMRVDQPRQLTAPATRTFGGSGTTATSLFTLSKGAWKFTWECPEEGYFGITLLDRDGNYVDLVANQVDQSSGSSLVGVASTGQYLLNVESEGSWSLTCEIP
jgi:hypothetical protein